VDTFVSVVVPAYNRASLTDRAVKSVLNQSYNNFELIVVNDGSDENYTDVKKLVESAGHTYLSLKENRGVAVARNAGGALARGEWLSFLDADDYWHEDKLLRQIQFHRKNPEYRISQCQEKWIRNGSVVNRKISQLTPNGDIFYDSVKRCCISASAVIIQTDLFHSTGGFDETLRVCEDYDLWLRLTKKFEVPLLADELVIKCRENSGHLSQQVPAQDRFRVYALIKLLVTEPLSAEKYSAVLSEIARKGLILQNGFQKRNGSEAGIYSTIAKLAGQALLISKTDEECSVIASEWNGIFEQLQKARISC